MSGVETSLVPVLSSFQLKVSTLELKAPFTHHPNAGEWRTLAYCKVCPRSSQPRRWQPLVKNPRRLLMCQPESTTLCEPRLEGRP